MGYIICSIECYACKLDRLSNSKSVARKQDADIANDREEAKKQKKTIMQYWSIKTSIQEQTYTLHQSSFNNSSLARETYSRFDSKSADDLKKRLLETAEKQIRIDDGDTWTIQVKGRLILINDLLAEEALLH